MFRAAAQRLIAAQADPASAQLRKKSRGQPKAPKEEAQLAKLKKPYKRILSSYEKCLVEALLRLYIGSAQLCEYGELQNPQCPYRLKLRMLLEVRIPSAVPHLSQLL
jgi:hypothetical protein